MEERRKEKLRQACFVVGLVLICVSMPLTASYSFPHDFTAREMYELFPPSPEFKREVAAQALNLYGCVKQPDGTYACPGVDG